MMPLSAVSYYFGRKPFPLKQKHPLNYTIKIFCFSPDGTKRLFFGNGKQKRAIIQPLLSCYHLSIQFLPLYSYTDTETLCIITETPILSRKLPSCFRDNTGSFRVCIWVLPASIDFCVIVSSFACEYPSFRDNNRLLPTSIYSQAKQPQNKSSYPL